jgi:hypothetical protein
MTSPSRYAATGTATWTAPDGTAVPYLLRRFLPQPGQLTALRTHVVGPGERIPTLSWLLADASAADRPSELNKVGTAITVPAGPGAVPAGPAPQPGVSGGQ